MTLLNAMKNDNDFTLTENGAFAHTTTGNRVYDMFAFGGAVRELNNNEKIFLFKQAFDEDPGYALKCLFYLRDIKEGQGERDFFRACLKWLAMYHPEAIYQNRDNILKFGRFDDIYALLNTPLDSYAMDYITELVNQACYEMGKQKNISLAYFVFKWLPSLNASSYKTKRLARRLRDHFSLTNKEYRHLLSYGRQLCNVLERLMSDKQWDKIEFNKLPSVAGLRYIRAFKAHDIERKKANVASYEDFAKNTENKVNAGALYPANVVHQAIDLMETGYGYTSRNVPIDDVNRLMVNKYWDNLTDYFKDATLNALAVVDTSGSMTCGMGTIKPIDVAISLGMYCAERAKGPFANHFISFASMPQLLEIDGVDFCDKVDRIYRKNLCDTTNLLGVFDLLLNTAKRHNLSQADLPENIIVISDMQIDQGARLSGRSFWGMSNEFTDKLLTEMETIRIKWEANGYSMPKLVYWNVEASNRTILEKSPNVSYVSGYSPVIFQSILTGKTGIDLMYDILNKDRYKDIIYNKID